MLFFLPLVSPPPPIYIPELPFLTSLIRIHSTFQAAVFVSPVCVWSLRYASVAGQCEAGSVSQSPGLCCASIWGILSSIQQIFGFFSPCSLNSCQSHVKYSEKCCLQRGMCLSSSADDSYSCRLFLFLHAVG